jgi:hypothetical protein
VISPNSRRNRHMLLSTSNVLSTCKDDIIRSAPKGTAMFTNSERSNSTMKTRGNDGDA